MFIKSVQAVTETGTIKQSLHAQLSLGVRGVNWTQMRVFDQPKYSSDSFVLQTAGNRHVFRTVYLHLSVWRSVGYWHLTVCYRPGRIAGYCCVHSALINYEWMRMGEDTWLLVWETVYLYWRQGGPRWGEVRYLSVSVCCLCRGSNILHRGSLFLITKTPSCGSMT